MQQRMMERARNKHRRVNAMRMLEENTSAFGNLLSFDGRASTREHWIQSGSDAKLWQLDHCLLLRQWTMHCMCDL